MDTGNRTTPSVSLKPDERQWLEEKASQAGVSLGRYMRQVALCQRSQEGERIGKDHRIKQLVTELNAIGNNVNQLARKANETGSINKELLIEFRDKITRLEIKLLKRLG